MSDVIDVAGAVFGGVWDMLTGIVYPGTGMTIAVILIGAFVVVWSLRLLGSIFGFNIGNAFPYADAAVKGISVRGGNNNRLQITDGRKDDKF